MKLLILIFILFISIQLNSQVKIEPAFDLKLEGGTSAFPMKVSESEFYMVYPTMTDKFYKYKVEFFSDLKSSNSFKFKLPYKPSTSKINKSLNNLIVLDDKLIIFVEDFNKNYNLNYSIINSDLTLEAENKTLISEIIPSKHETFGMVNLSVSKNKSFFSVVYVKPHLSSNNQEIEFKINVYKSNFELFSENSFKFKLNKDYFSAFNQFILNDDGSFLIKIDNF